MVRVVVMGVTFDRRTEPCRDLDIDGAKAAAEPSKLINKAIFIIKGKQDSRLQQWQVTQADGWQVDQEDERNPC